MACQVLPWEQALDGFHNVSQIRDTIRQISEEVLADSPSRISIALDAEFCNYSLMEIDPTWSADEQLEFSLHQRFGDTPFFRSFQYPVDAANGVYLNIDCPVVLRRAIHTALASFRQEKHLLAIGIFSAFSYALRNNSSLEHGRHLFWRASSHGRDQWLEINNGEFQALHLMDRDGSRVRHVHTVGHSRLKKAIASFIEQLGDGQDALFPEVETVYTYLGSGHPDFLAAIFERELSSISLLNPFWQWNWPDVPEADNRFEQSAFVELANSIWQQNNV